MPSSVVCSGLRLERLPLDAGRPSSVIQSPLRPSRLRRITVRKRRAIVITPAALRVYGCSAATSK